VAFECGSGAILIVHDSNPEQLPKTESQSEPVPMATVPAASRRPQEPTVGTGSIVAIGCVIAMALVLGAGILYVLVIR
jgi:hypothetical protein